jgi:hypothetical protein
VAGSLEVDAVVAVEDESIVAAGFVGALCWARPGWPAKSTSRTLHTPASELWICELRFILPVLISVISIVEIWVGAGIAVASVFADSFGIMGCLR